jgi:protein-L-isoaspartate(D-aspartate) O-methyltransferase
VGPFDAIHVGAAAPVVPDELVQQLAQPGRMFIPVGSFAQTVLLIDKDEQGNITEQKLFGVSVSLVDFFCHS